jgi:hypothetical protein
MAEPAIRLTPGIGPKRVLVEVTSCVGCPALMRYTWRDEDGDHTGARCSAMIALDEAALITNRWRPDRHPPSWCPGDPNRRPYA